MTKEMPLAITISRQLGSGGAFLGQRIAEKMNMLYLDREIIKEVADKLGVTAEHLEWRDEKVSSRWQTIINSLAFTQAEFYSPPDLIMPSDKEIFETESEIISKISQKNSVVVIGRCGSYVLKNHPRHISIFLHADMNFRLKRVQEIYKLSEKEALKFIKSVDVSRARYVHEFTKNDMHDVRQYHLSLDTGVLGMDGAEDVIMNYIHTRFKDLE